MSVAVVGFCRFSFLGRGDWPEYRSIPIGEEADYYEDIAANLFDPDRMERRLWTFENITIPSIKAQTDKNFTYVVLASDVMPAIYQQRLIEICANIPQVTVIFSEKRNLGDVIKPVLADLWDTHDDVVQFRLDDDDAIAINYVEKVHDYARRLAGIGAFAITMTRGLTAVISRKEPLWYAFYNRPFQSAASIIRFANRDRTVFDVGHYAMQQRYTHIQDVQTCGSFMLQWPSASRNETLANIPSDWEKVGRHRFLRRCEESFPFLADVNFEHLRDQLD
ncbi:glycosyltransferase [Ketogulonicigenium vulgare]|uniref:glycosyltransferase n=1 Tax=Ketogulonicigenium vulgare TaxID=92945 RepID=UPI002359C5C0|nr:glycosyltransferase [Ketogulonicigenium vulgare]